MKFQIKITPRKDILDAQGATIKNSLLQIGFKNITDIRQGKLIEVVIDNVSEKKALQEIEKAADELLVNKITEDYVIEKIE